MTLFLASALRFTLNLAPTVVAAAGWLALMAPSSQSAPLPPLNNAAQTSVSVPSPGVGGPKRPGPVVAPTQDPVEASLRQGGPRRPGLITPGHQQSAETETAERLRQP